MRVLIATNMWPFPGAPSFGVFVKEQAEALAAAGVQVVVSAHLGRRSKWNYVRGLFALTRVLRAGPFDVIHSHHPYSTLLAWAARALAGRRGVPIIQSFHDGEIFRATRFRQPLLQRLKYSFALKRLALRRCAHVLPTHPGMLPRLFGPAAAARIPHTVLPAGITLARFGAQGRAEARAALGLDAARRYVFFPAEPARPEKRFALAQAAVALARAQHPNLELLAGGTIGYEQIPAYMAAVDVVLVTSDYETGPLVAREALASETPLVATDVGDIRLRYGDLPGVCIAPPEPAALAAGLAAALRVTGPFGGRERIRALGLDQAQIAARLCELYAAVCGGGGG